MERDSRSSLSAGSTARHPVALSCLACPVGMVGIIAPALPASPNSRKFEDRGGNVGETAVVSKRCDRVRTVLSSIQSPSSLHPLRSSSAHSKTEAEVLDALSNQV